MQYKLSEILMLIGGGTPKTTNPSYWGGSIPWLSVVDFNNDNRYVHTTEKTITEDGVQNSSTKILPQGALILSARGTVGALAQLAKPMAFNQSCYGITAKEQTTNDFLYYLLKNIVKDLQAKGHGSVFNTITRDTFDTIIVNLPPLDEQKRIAGILGALDDKIELLQKQNKTLEDMAKAIFKSWFVDFDVVHAKQKGLPKADIMREYHLTDELYDLFPSDFENSSLGPIPLGWTSTELKYYCQICSGFAFKSSNFNKNGKYKLVTIRNVQDGFFVQAVKDNITDIPSKMPDYCYLQDGDILLSLTGNVGRICLVYGKNYLLNQRVAKLLPRNSGDYMFLYSLFRTPSVYKKMQELAVGSAQQNLSPILTGNILFPLINRRILDIFSEITLPMYRKILINNKQIQTLTELRDALLPRLISGKIRV